MKMALMIVLIIAMVAIVHSEEPGNVGKTEIKIIEGMPDDLILDGAIKEWSMPASIEMNCSGQVAGMHVCKDKRDFRARIWAVLCEKGFVLAGEVTDEKVLFPDDQSVFNADHVELWLAFPAAEIPPLGFGNQFRFVEAKGQKWCETLGGEVQLEQASIDECNAWVEAQESFRSILPRLFAYQYIISSQGIHESYLSSVIRMVPGTHNSQFAPAGHFFFSQSD